MGARGTWPRRARAAWTTAVAGALALGGAPGVARAADADPPDVVMIIPNGGGTPRAVASGEPSFDRLRELLRPEYTGTRPVPRAWTRGRYPRVRVTVVWGLTGVGGWPQTSRAPGGDTAVERVDQLFLAGDGTPWVRTDPAPDVEDDDIRWHRAPRDLYDRLDRAGLLGAPVSAASDRSGSRSAVPLWWAAAGGLAAGAAATFLACRAADRRRTGPPRGEPRQELIDL
ncbi:hypothetical protein ABZ467_29820 [Streptomyces sp. NPDC005727]|uniref:hypothetical protein n=2 Tax=unclassified Streptomyces TaxID=2593676 RepID=UPI0033E5EC18